MKKFTPEQKLSRWEFQREIKNLMGRMSADYLLKLEKNMFKNYWSSRSDVCFGVNQGYYTGADAVKGYYAAMERCIMDDSRRIQAAFPEQLGGLGEDEIRGVGMIDYKPVDTAVIEIAEDNQTAKGLWCIRGSHSRLTEAGPVAYWEFGWFAVDFVFEDGKWRIWHLLHLDDICHPCGSSWAETAVKFDRRGEFEGAGKLPMPEPAVPRALRALYSTDRPFTPSPRLPEPYDTFSHTFSYGYREEDFA